MKEKKEKKRIKNKEIFLSQDYQIICFYHKATNIIILSIYVIFIDFNLNFLAFNFSI